MENFVRIRKHLRKSSPIPATQYENRLACVGPSPPSWNQDFSMFIPNPSAETQVSLSSIHVIKVFIWILLRVGATLTHQLGLTHSISYLPPDCPLRPRVLREGGRGDGENKKDVAVGKTIPGETPTGCGENSSGRRRALMPWGEGPGAWKQGQREKKSTFCLHPTKGKLFLLFFQVIISISENYYRWLSSD